MPGGGVQILSVNDKGFAIASLLYPAFIIIITIVVLTLITLIQSSFSINKLNSEVHGDLTDNNTMKSIKENAETILIDSKDKNKIDWSGDADGKVNLYNVTQGKIKLVDQSGNEVDSDLTTEANTTNWKGRFFTESDGSQFLLLDNGKYCAYKTGDMSGVAVYNSGEGKTNECIQKLAEQTNCSEVVTMMDNQNTVTTLQKQVADLITLTNTQSSQIKDLQSVNATQASEIASLKSVDAIQNANISTAKSTNDTQTSQISSIQSVNNTQASQISSIINTNNTQASQIANQHPVGSFYITRGGENPASLFGGSWTKIYDRFLLGAGSSYALGATGGESSHTLSLYELPGSVVWHNYRGGTAMVSLTNESWNANGWMYGALDSWGVSAGQPHNNMPPYYAVYMWVRTA